MIDERGEMSEERGVKRKERVEKGGEWREEMVD